jgi:multiple sugar transport system substrate-binding protein
MNFEAHPPPAHGVRGTLTGITWDHPRGRAPLEAASLLYRDADVRWSARSLLEFAETPVSELAARYDLLVIDHPHLGTAARAGALVALDDLLELEALDALAERSVGPSHRSYELDGRQWALAIDAAAQVAAFRPDLIAQPPAQWAELRRLSRSGRVVWPLQPVDAYCSWATLLAHTGTPLPEQAEAIDDVDLAAWGEVLAHMRETAGALPRRCLELNAIGALEALASGDELAFCPLVFGYVSYSRAGFRPRRLRFTDFPAMVGTRPAGSILGGAGLAVSARSRAPERAARYALWVAGGHCQRGAYFEAGGQPAHADAWDDPAVDEAAGHFFSGTRATVEAAWLRPRRDGFVGFQHDAGVLIHAFLAGERDLAATVAALRQRWHAPAGS